VTAAGVEVFLSARSTASDPMRPELSSDPDTTAQGEIWVKADRVRLRQVLVNLLSNAVKYNRPGGSVTLSCKIAGDQCEILIADTGQGIPPDRLPSLFEPFNRLGAETSKVEGTGIGLVLSRQLAEMMGGTLSITSTFGEGTVASLKLVMAAAPTASPALPALNHHEGRTDRPLRVLYAEDNEVNAELMRQVVTLRPSVSLRVAENGTMALELATLDPPDLMLVDMNLGDMTGLDLARSLQRDHSTRGVRLIAISADALPEQIQAAMRSGFQGYLTKPINFREVLAVLDEYSQVG